MSIYDDDADVIMKEALMGKVMTSWSDKYGVVFVTPDYRNYPQGNISDMVCDVRNALQWAHDNIKYYNGDIQNITLIGQSAGAHISACMLLESLCPKKQNTNYNFQIKTFIGISGNYNILESLHNFEKKGLPSSIVNAIMNNDMKYYSPSIQLQQMIHHSWNDGKMCANYINNLPPIYLFHGKADKTVPWTSTQEFYILLTTLYDNSNVKKRHIVKYFNTKSHTDVIIEDPIGGSNSVYDDIDDDLTYDILNIIYDSNTKVLKSYCSYKQQSLMPLCFIQLARKINPF